MWTFIGLAETVSAYEFDKLTGQPMTLVGEIPPVLINDVTYAILTPFVYQIALRYLIQRDNWPRRSIWHIFGSLMFAVVHVAIRGLVYPVWDPRIRGYAYAAFNPHSWHWSIQWILFERLFAFNVVSDVVSIYMPILLVAHAVWYYKKLRERDLRTSQLEAQLSQARLQALKSQLQPHFLFNTLHSISALVLTDAHAADRMIVRLSDLLRMSLESSDVQETTLAREIEFVLSYVEIEKIRFADRLKVVLEIAPDTLDAQVPHLVLQPLVENAVRHGIAKRSADGVVRIAAKREGERLFLEVRDNGPGLGELDPQSTGVGLTATRDRLQTLYGNDQAVEIRNVPQSGLEVSVQIPFRTESRLLYEVAADLDPSIQ